MDLQPSTSTVKRKREVMLLQQKLEIISLLKKGATAAALSVQFGVPRTTINDLKKMQTKSSNLRHKWNRPMADRTNVKR